jgi:hypothetical protein
MKSTWLLVFLTACFISEWCAVTEILRGNYSWAGFDFVIACINAALAAKVIERE